MRIKSGERDPEPQVDLSELLHSFSEKYRNIFFHQIGQEVFIFKTLGRKDYHDLMRNEEIDNMLKEDVICKSCVLWPENYDFDSCSAGVPTELCKVILKNSFLDSEASKDYLLQAYREEMYDIQNQVNCLINEAFPEFGFEEIENWDMEQTMKYLSRAEWKLVNLRGLDYIKPQGEDHLYPREEAKEPVYSNRTEEINASPINNKKIDLEELRKMKEKFPEIRWEEDVVLHEGEDGLKQNIDTTAGPLRTDL